ncbi:MAG: trypsin-like serine protease [Polyangiaceae bacterium]|nr:trypsin-like serine protease [Polyangiaceae bacterium]
MRSTLPRPVSDGAQSGSPAIGTPTASEGDEAISASPQRATKNATPNLSRSARKGETTRYPDVLGVLGSSGLKCSATLIASRWAITAKHCLPAGSIFMGNDAGSAKAIAIERTLSHPSPDVDVALLRLKTAPPTTARKVRTEKSSDGSAFVRIIGFGATNAAATTGVGIKRFFDVPRSSSKCDAARAKRLGCKAAHELVLLSSTGLDTCRGDSGGAVLEESNGEEYLVAVTSRGVPLPGRLCGYGGIYTRIDTIWPWVEENLREGTR